jgi:phage shock protein PspC (stress-responsive transcriptional regulator)
MNKIITVNIGGRAIKIEENAHQILEKYLNKIESSFNQSENGAEILEDIEARVSDLLQEKLDQGAGFITPEAVQEVIDRMGDPADIEDEEAGEAEPAKKANTRHRKLYRDPDDRMVGGVCAGLGKYFNISPTIMRIGLLVSLFFFGFGLIPYLILWAIIPKANTAAQKLEMEGINPTIDNIADSIRKEAGEVADSLRNSGSIGNFIQKSIEILAQVVKVVLKVVVVIFLVALCLGAIALFVGLILGMGSLSFAALSIDLDSIFQVHDNSLISYSMRIALFFILATPIVGIILLLVRITRNTPRLRAVNIGLWSLWGVSIIYFVGSLIYTIRSVKDENEIVREMDIAPIDTLYVHYAEFGTEIEEVFNRSTVHFKPSNEWILTEKRSARGSSLKEASEVASEIVLNTKVDGNHLYLDAIFEQMKSNVLRNQSAHYDVRIPIGTVIKIENDIPNPNYSYTLKVGKNTIRRIGVQQGANELEKGTYVMTSKGLNCEGCESQMEANLSPSIRKILVKSPLSLRIYQTSKSSYNTSQGVQAEMVGNTLTLQYDEDIDDLEMKPKVEVYVTDLNELTLESLAEVELENIRSEELNISIEGAASLEAEDLDIKTLNLELDGASRVKLDGISTNLNIVQNGGASIDASKLSCLEANIIINGLSNCQLNAKDKITGSISGAGKLTYSGAPEIEVDTEGIIKVVRK